MSFFRLAWKSFATMEGKHEESARDSRHSWVIDKKMGLAWRLYFGRFGVFGKVAFIAPVQNGFIRYDEAAPTLNWFQRKIMFYRIVWTVMRAEANELIALKKKREDFIREHAVTTMMNGGLREE